MPVRLPAVVATAATGPTTLPPVTTEMLVVLGVVGLALVLFLTEALPVDVTAILVMVVLIVLEPWTGIDAAEGVSGFANPATVSVLALLILASGVRETGLVQRLGRRMAAFAGDDPRRQLAATVGVAGPVSGVVNNTPVVAILVPVVSDMAHRGDTSPSKLLIPLSYASQLGGMLTLVGTSTSILASDVSGRLGATYPGLRAFDMFEFTLLGVVVLVVGSAYLMTVGYRLLPERVPAADDYLAEYELAPFLAEVAVDEGSPLVGQRVAAAFADAPVDADVIGLERDGERFLEPLGAKVVQAGDVLTVRAARAALDELVALDDLTVVGAPATDEALDPTTGDGTRDGDPDGGGDGGGGGGGGGDDQTLVEVVITRGSFLAGETLRSTTFRSRYDANVLAIRSRGALVRERLDEVRVRVGDTLLVQATAAGIDRLADSRDFIVAHESAGATYRTSKAPVAVAVVAGVVLLPALGLAPILVSALAGVVAMVLTGVLRPNEMYSAVEWNVVFLLAGVIPLGVALEQTGAAALLGAGVAVLGAGLPPLLLLWVFYVATGLITEVVSNNASVVLMLPVAAEVAVRTGNDPFAFAMAVTFACSTAFLGPVGYQTNLFVYGPGGYRVSDYARVGAPLQLVLSVVTTLGIAAIWGL